MKLRSSLILFFLVFFSGAVNAGELCRWKLKEDKTEYTFLDVHNLVSSTRVQRIYEKEESIKKGASIPTITCIDGYKAMNKSELKNGLRVIPKCYTPWNGKITFGHGVNSRGVIEEIYGRMKYEGGRLVTEDIQNPILLSFIDKKNNKINLYTYDKLKQIYKDGSLIGQGFRYAGIFLDRFLSASKEFKHPCNAKNLKIGYRKFICSNGICTEVINQTEMLMSHGYGWGKISYKFNDEYRDLAVIRKVIRTYEINKTKHEKGSF